MIVYKHEVTEFAPKTWCISEFRLVNAFLVEGKEKAALIDTGCGIGDLATVVQELTDKPLVVIMTHNHFDHCGGASQFADCPVYIHPEDGTQMEFALNMMKKMNKVTDLTGLRREFITSRAPIRYPEADIEELLKCIPKEEESPLFFWQPVTDGQEIDLGKRVLKMIHTPGHTSGGISILDSGSRTLFTGDTVNYGIILMRQPGNDTRLILECHNTMQKLWNMETKYDRLAVGHDMPTLSKQIIKNYLDLTAGLLDGSIVGTYEETAFRKGEVARLGMAELWYQCDAWELQEKNYALKNRI